MDNIPVYILIQRNDGGDNDGDADSVLSFITAGAPNYSEDLWDSESRWVESSAFPAPSCCHHKRQSLPQHPQRSLSFSSSNHLNMSGSFQHTPSPPKETATRKTIPSREKRTNRLRRMADRAKAVATRTPTRRKSFQFQRHSMPPNMPLRKGSANGSSLDCSYSSGHSSSGMSPRAVGMARTRRRHSLNLATRTAIAGVVATRRRNSLQCVQPIGGPARSGGLESLQGIKRHRQQASPGPCVRRSTGCFQIACGGINRPPRLPQRCPSECPPTAGEQQ